MDELYTMKECDPEISFKNTIDFVLAYESKSTFYFILEKIMFFSFGYTELVARILSVVAGVAGVYAMYLLGKEIWDQRTGLFSALVISLNYFHIQYSQEARGYTLLFLFVVLSFLHFIKFLKGKKLKNVFWYSICIILAIHFHPFALFVLSSQIILWMIFLLKGQ